MERQFFGSGMGYGGYPGYGMGYGGHGGHRWFHHVYRC